MKKVTIEQLLMTATLMITICEKSTELVRICTFKFSHFITLNYLLND